MYCTPHYNSHLIYFSRLCVGDRQVHPQVQWFRFTEFQLGLRALIYYSERTQSKTREGKRRLGWTKPGGNQAQASKSLLPASADRTIPEASNCVICVQCCLPGNLIGLSAQRFYWGLIMEALPPSTYQHCRLSGWKQVWKHTPYCLHKPFRCSKPPLSVMEWGKQSQNLRPRNQTRQADFSKHSSPRPAMLTSPHGFTNSEFYILNPLLYPLPSVRSSLPNFCTLPGPFFKVSGWIFQLLILPQLPQHLYGNQSQDSFVLLLTPIVKV